MAQYLVRARPYLQKLAELKRRLQANEIKPMQPFGTPLDLSLRNARRLPHGRAEPSSV